MKFRNLPQELIDDLSDDFCKDHGLVKTTPSTRKNHLEFPAYKDFRFGDVIENHLCTEFSSRRFGYFIEAKDKGRGNRREKVVVLTDGKGSFWEIVIGGSNIKLLQRADLPKLFEDPNKEKWS